MSMTNDRIINTTAHAAVDIGYPTAPPLTVLVVSIALETSPNAAISAAHPGPEVHGKDLLLALDTQTTLRD